MRWERVRPTISWQHRLLVACTSAIRLGELLWSSDWVSRRAARDFARERVRARPVAAPGRRARGGLRVTRDDFAGWPVWVLQASPSERPPAVIVYLHGGAYVGQIGGLQWDWIAGIARRTGARVFVPIYPLAPWGTAAEAVPTAADLVQRTMTRFGADRVAVVGDSAGGGLALAVLQEIAHRRQKQPARALLLSPWLDLAVSDDRSQHVRDPLLAIPGLRAAGRLWAGDLDPANPIASPLNGELDGLPPIVVLAGDRDILYPDTDRLIRHAEEEGADVRVTMYAGLVHTWSIMPFLPETKAAWPLIRKALLG